MIFTMNAESEKRRRLSLTKAQLHEEKGSALLALLADIVADGKLTDDEIQRLGVWLNDNRDSEMPAIHFLLDCVNGIVARGQLFEADRTELFIGIEKVLPLTERGIAKQAREHAEMEVKKRFGKVGAKITRDDLKRMIEETKENPEPPPKRHANWRDDPMSEPQLHFIRSLGGSISSSATKGEASDLIDQLLRNKPVSNRHQMVLRFWNRTIGSDEGPREITEWLDAFYTEDPDRKLAWELESGDDGTQGEPGRVPSG